MGWYYMPTLIANDGTVRTLSSHDYGNGPMRPMTDYIWDEVIHPSAHEPIPKDDGEAIRNIAQWDHGEFAQPSQPLSNLYGLDGRIVTKDDYVLFRSNVGDTALCRKGSECHPYELR